MCLLFFGFVSCKICDFVFNFENEDLDWFYFVFLLSMGKFGFNLKLERSYDMFCL